MSDIEQIQEFEGRKIRTAWVEEDQEWYFSIIDVCGDCPRMTPVAPGGICMPQTFLTPVS